MKIVPSRLCLPANLKGLVGTMLHEPTQNIHHDFEIEEPFLALYSKGFLPEGSHLEEQAVFVWNDLLKSTVAEKTKSSRPIWELIPEGMPLLKNNVFIHKRFTAMAFSDSCVEELLREHAIPLYIVLGLLITLDPTKPCKGSPLSSLTENYIATIVGDRLVFIRVQFINTRQEKKWLLYPPATSIPQNKVLLFSSTH